MDSLLEERGRDTPVDFIDARDIVRIVVEEKRSLSISGLSVNDRLEIVRRIGEEYGSEGGVIVVAPPRWVKRIEEKLSDIIGYRGDMFHGKGVLITDPKTLLDERFYLINGDDTNNVFIYVFGEQSLADPYGFELLLHLAISNEINKVKADTNERIDIGRTPMVAFTDVRPLYFASEAIDLVREADLPELLYYDYSPSRDYIVFDNLGRILYERIESNDDVPIKIALDYYKKGYKRIAIISHWPVSYKLPVTRGLLPYNDDIDPPIPSKYKELKELIKYGIYVVGGLHIASRGWYKPGDEDRYYIYPDSENYMIPIDPATNRKILELFREQGEGILFVFRTKIVELLNEDPTLLPDLDLLIFYEPTEFAHSAPIFSYLYHKSRRVLRVMSRGARYIEIENIIGNYYLPEDSIIRLAKHLVVFGLKKPFQGLYLYKMGEKAVLNRIKITYGFTTEEEKELAKKIYEKIKEIVTEYEASLRIRGGHHYFLITYLLTPTMKLYGPGGYRGIDRAMQLNFLYPVFPDQKDRATRYIFKIPKGIWAKDFLAGKLTREAVREIRMKRKLYIDLIKYLEDMEKAIVAFIKYAEQPDSYVKLSQKEKQIVMERLDEIRRAKTIYKKILGIRD